VRLGVNIMEEQEEAGENAIEANGITIRYHGGKEIVSSCTFSVKKGEVFGLLGSNGAGKSTILKALAGVVKEFSGEFLVFGQNARHWHDLLQSKVAYVPQYPCMFSDFTVMENLSFFCGMEGLGGQKKKERINELMEGFSLSKFANTPARKLSGGYRQLLNIALSNILDKEIILLDEPTAGLDLLSKKLVVSYICNMRKRGRTVVLTTHDLQDAEDLCDNVVILSGGRILGQGNMRHLLTEMGGGYVVSVSLRRPINLKYLSLEASRIILASGKRVIVETSTANIGPAIREFTLKLAAAGAQIDELDIRAPSLNYVFSSLMETEVGE
jgi:ABC-2 type transport system ATP-binding protein